jgi:hypothetical protein
MHFKDFNKKYRNAHYGQNRQYSYETAAASCATIGGRLPEIHSAFENEYLRALIAVRILKKLYSFKLKVLTELKKTFIHVSKKICIA